MFIDLTINQLIQFKEPSTLNIAAMDKDTDFGHTDNDCVAFFISSYFVI